MKRHEDVLVFSGGKCPYYPAMRQGRMRARGGGNASTVYGKCVPMRSFSDQYYPTSIIEIHNADQTKKEHPTQKPVSLFEYLIRTYTNEGDTVLDNCAGSGTTGVACLNTGRKFILIEKDASYCEIIRKRIENHMPLLQVGQERG
jgi:site-specific DNA-methyltransferase (adenine-specific)